MRLRIEIENWELRLRIENWELRLRIENWDWDWELRLRIENWELRITLDPKVIEVKYYIFSWPTRQDEENDTPFVGVIKKR